MPDTGCVPKGETIRERLDQLHGLLTEALTIEERLSTGSSDEKERVVNAPVDTVLGTIEQSLDKALHKANKVTSQLRRMEDRL